VNGLADIFLYLLAAAIAVPIANRIGLGSVLGYLLAGVALGPALGLLGDNVEDVMHFSEFGVVMMLFLIGLELRPKVLWGMRRDLLGLGGLQMLGSALLLGAGAFAFGVDWQVAVAIGLILALSSTAIVLQTLQERQLERTSGGRSAFAVLLFQDIAVIPILAVMPLLAVNTVAHHGDDHAAPGHAGSALMEMLPLWVQPLAILAVIASIILAGRFLAYPIFRFVASGRSPEIFTAAALALVIGSALFVSAVGLSPALGAFLAGVVLSGSEYRHQLESDIAPFKGLLLGIFFISVGAAVDFGLLAEQPVTIVGLAAIVIAIKAAVLAVLGQFFGRRGADLWLFSLSLPQAGEFGFALFIVFEKIVKPRLKPAAIARDADVIDRHGQVIIAGLGRFGQVVNRVLNSDGVETVVLDEDERQVETLRRFGIEAYYGDASKPALLEAAGIKQAKVLVAGLGNTEKQLRLIETVRQHWPHVHIIARANDRKAAYQLTNAGAHRAVREMFSGSVETGREVLKELGVHPYRAERVARRFRNHDQETFDDLREIWSADFRDNPDYIANARARAQQLNEVMEADRSHAPETDDWAVEAALRFEESEEESAA